MGNKIEHKGKIENINKDLIQVRIMQSSACCECHAKSLCSSADSKEKLIDVYSPNASKYQIGDEVTVCGLMTMGKKAVFIAFGIPLVIIILFSFISAYFFHFKEDEIVVGIILLLSLYYFIIKLFNNKLSKHFSFWIE